MLSLETGLEIVKILGGPAAMLVFGKLVRVARKVANAADAEEMERRFAAHDAQVAELVARVDALHAERGDRHECPHR